MRKYQICQLFFSVYTGGGLESTIIIISRYFTLRTSNLEVSNRRHYVVVKLLSRCHRDTKIKLYSTPTSLKHIEPKAVIDL